MEYRRVGALEEVCWVFILLAEGASWAGAEIYLAGAGPHQEPAVSEFEDERPVGGRKG